MAERVHTYPPRKIGQVGVVFASGHHGVGALVEEGKLVTEPLEAFGLGLVFVARKRVALALYDAIREGHPSVRLAEENDEVSYLRRTLHEDKELGCYVTYSRGVLGIVNIHDVRFLAVDANAFRAVASFTPGEITPEEFRRARAEELKRFLPRKASTGCAIEILKSAEKEDQSRVQE